MLKALTKNDTQRSATARLTIKALLKQRSLLWTNTAPITIILPRIPVAKRKKNKNIKLVLLLPAGYRAAPICFLFKATVVG